MISSSRSRRLLVLYIGLTTRLGSLARNVVLSLIVLWSTFFFDFRLLSASTCTHYASPTGTGTGSAVSSPFKISNFWPIAKPGFTLCLLDGQYTDSASMINPPQNLSGTASAPITVSALNDGKVTINGQGSFRPVLLSYNNYFVLEGFNASNSNDTVISLNHSNHNIVRRVAGWDAADNNTNIFGVHNGTYNLLEDVAGWGIARKIFSASQGGDYTTIRRAWGRWEGSHVIGPKMTYTLAYNNYNLTVENAIGTWSGERLKQTYTLLDYYGQPWTGAGAGTYSNYRVNQPYGIFAIDRLEEINARTKLLGSIAYIHRDDRSVPTRGVFVLKMDSFEVANTTIYVEPGSHTSTQGFKLATLDTGVPINLLAKNLTAIGGNSSDIHSTWRPSNISQGSLPGSVPNVFTSTNGANICYRYKDSSLTSEPLWPWPMNKRIKDAMVESGRAPVDVTQTVESMFGPIPEACKSAATVTVRVPAAPILRIITP